MVYHKIFFPILYLQKGKNNFTLHNTDFTIRKINFENTIFRTL